MQFWMTAAPNHTKRAKQRFFILNIKNHTKSYFHHEMKNEATVKEKRMNVI